ncbi:MAG: hypothetical protein F4Y28_16635 [Acidimicrobiia bacterium]|nr:hypothetical protein [Acidimicrobiia bacterium]MYG58096.1 hypothetical protein [Acidimicrobiia bacterium]MYJ32999.1 hypothetical protein [Acidimicrobiia bacterium]
MVEESRPAVLEELIEEQLQYLKGVGPEPDLGGLEEEVLKSVLGAFQVVEALVDAAPGAPHLVHDPVAIRLGLVDSPKGPPVQASADADDPITAAVYDLERRFSIACSPAATDGTEFVRRFECRSMVEHILVVAVPEGTSRAAMTAHARSAFALADDLSAVVYATESGNNSVVLTYAESHRMLDPTSGWIETSSESGDDPLEIALGRYLEQSDPQWSQIQGLVVADVLGGIDADVVTIVQETKRALESTNPRLEHKKDARIFVLGCENSVFVDWARRVQGGTATGDDMIEEIRSLIENKS